MSQIIRPYWFATIDPSVIPMGAMVPCSSNNCIPTFVVGMFDNDYDYPQLGYIYYTEGSFSSGYFMKGTDEAVEVPKGFHFLVGGNVSFRPHTEVAENLRCVVGHTKDNKPVYIGTIKNGVEEICGPVIDGVCHVNNLSVCSDSENYKILALNEEGTI